jgi:hypothetical protein
MLNVNSSYSTEIPANLVGKQNWIGLSNTWRSIHRRKSSASALCEF